MRDALKHAETACPATAGARFSVLGVNLLSVARQQAVAMLEEIIRRREGRVRSVFIVNAHTLNLAAGDPSYRQVLNASDFVFPDGTGIRWAARLQGIRVAENLVGTDFVPAFLHAAAGRGYSYFLLGADRQTIASAAQYTRRTFAGWAQAGYHHGYLADEATTAAAIVRINRARPDVLLVGMGNPLQENWVHRNRHRLRVPVCIGVGGLYDYWAGNVSRAPKWLRRLGHEWLWRLYQQPGLKARRYLIGNPLFLARIVRQRLAMSGRKTPAA